MIVKTESYSGITLLVDNDFDEDWDSPILKGVLKDFPKESRRTIFPERDEVEMINEGEDIKIEPEFYLTKDRVVNSLTVLKSFFLSLFNFENVEFSINNIFD